MDHTIVTDGEAETELISLIIIVNSKNHETICITSSPPSVVYNNVRSTTGLRHQIRHRGGGFTSNLHGCPHHTPNDVVFHPSPGTERVLQVYGE